MAETIRLPFWTPDFVSATCITVTLVTIAAAFVKA